MGLENEQRSQEAPMWFRRKTDDCVEASAALEDAEKNLKDVKKRGDEVSKVSRALREFRERNHLGEQIEEIIIRGKG